MDLTKVNFTTSENYLKRSALCGTALLTLPGYGGNVSTTINHNLGYVPLFNVGVEFDTADEIIVGGEKVNTITDQGFLSGLGADPPYPDLSAWATTTQLVVRLDNFTSPTATGTRRVYFYIYLDYSNA